MDSSQGSSALVEYDAATLVRVHSVTGPSYIDHGPFAGTLAHILRLGSCNLTCDWCPVPETWDRATLDTAVPLTTTTALADRVVEQMMTDPELPVLITGGEPLLSDHAILDLTDRVRATGLHPRWLVETNGTLPPPDWWTGVIYHTVVSPKVGTRDPRRRRIVPAALDAWTALHWRSRADFDITVTNGSDVLHAIDLSRELDVAPSRIWLTPRPGCLDRVYDTAQANGFRLHTALDPKDTP